MSGRHLRAGALVVLGLALAAQTVRLHHRIQAGYLLAQVEGRTQDAIARRRAASTMFAEHLDWLDRAGRLDGLEVGVPIARGAQFLLLRRPSEAIEAYTDAARLEPRPEIDLNLGRAYWMAGDEGRAREAFARAVRLNPRLATEVPAEARPPATP